MRLTAKLIVLALTATAVSAQNFVNGTRTWIGNGNWATYYNGTGEGCGTSSGGCDVDCSSYGSTGNNAMTLNMFSGASDHSSYTFRMHNIANLHASQMMVNQQNNPVALYVEVDAGFSVSNLYIGVTGYMRTVGSLSQNSAVLTVSNLYMSNQATINSPAFKINVGNGASLSDGATVNVATLLLHNSASIGNVAVTTSVGLLMAAVVTAANTLFSVGGQLVLENPAGSNAATTYGLTCSGSTQVNTVDMYTVAPFSALNCPFAVSNTFYSTPAANGNKRDGSTQSTTFTGGSSNSNTLTQTGSYLGNLLRKREMNEKRVAVYPNQLVLSAGHQMQVNNGLNQNGVTPTITITSCDCKMDMGFTTQSVAQACSGCQSTATGCTNGVFATQPVGNGGSGSGNKRGDEEASN